MIQNRSRIVLCDLEGTLVNSIPAVRRAIVQTAREFGADGTDQEIYSKVIDYNARAVYAGDLDRFFQRIFELLSEPRREIAIGLTDVYPDTFYFLAKLQVHKAKLGVISDTPEERAQVLVNQLELRPFLVTVQSISESNPRPDKPHPEIALRALRAMSNSNGDQIYVVGDSAMDIKCGQNLAQALSRKVTTILVNRLGTAQVDPDYEAKDLHDAANYILAN